MRWTYLILAIGTGLAAIEQFSSGHHNWAFAVASVLWFLAFLIGVTHDK